MRFASVKLPLEFWRPLVISADDNRGCMFCPQRGVFWFWQRAVFRLLLIEDNSPPRSAKPLRYVAARLSVLYLLALAVEAGLQIWLPLKEYWMRALLIIGALVLIAVPAACLIWLPTAYTPLTAFLVSCAQAAYAAWLSYHMTGKSATRLANAKWLPQAESACDRLLTVGAALTRFEAQLKSACGRATKDHPELHQQNMRAVRTLIDHQCMEGANKLRDAANHMESAVADWQRFIGQNCDGDECNAIAARLLALRKRLDSQVAAACLAKDDSDAARAPSSLAAELIERAPVGELRGIVEGRE